MAREVWLLSWWRWFFDIFIIIETTLTWNVWTEIPIYVYMCVCVCMIFNSDKKNWKRFVKSLRKRCIAAPHARLSGHPLSAACCEKCIVFLGPGARDHHRPNRTKRNSRGWELHLVSRWRLSSHITRLTLPPRALVLISIINIDQLGASVGPKDLKDFLVYFFSWSFCFVYRLIEKKTGDSLPTEPTHAYVHTYIRINIHTHR